MSALFTTRGLEVHFAARGRTVRAIDGVDLAWEHGEVLGLVGESGCGKSTLGRALLGVERTTGGELLVDDEPVRDLRALRRRVQMVFQDPYQALNPKRSIGEQVVEGLEIQRIGTRAERHARGVAALEAAGLAPAEPFWAR